MSQEVRWRPIKTAPKDGTVILLAEPHPGGSDIDWWVTQGSWVDAMMEVPSSTVLRGWERIHCEPQWLTYHTAIMTGSKEQDYHDSFHAKIILLNPSHWMPIPNPPKMNPDKAAERLYADEPD
jgi:hypothetical protein